MKILFYPKGPRSWNKITSMIQLAGWEVTHNPFDNYDVAINWSGKAKHNLPDVLMELHQQGKKVINLNCNDVRKSTVDRIFREVYGYSSLVNPAIHKGHMVEKSEKQAAHDGTIILGPMKDPKPDHIYQRLINNVKKGLCLDIRIIVFGKSIPFVFLKTKPEHKRFSGTASDATIYAGDDPAEFFPDKSMEKMLQFIDLIGLDYGEIDVLFDNDSKQSYIIDVNKTPGNGIFKIWPTGTTHMVLKKMIESFKSELV